MSTLDAASLLSDPAPIWLDNAGLADSAASEHRLAESATERARQATAGMGGPVDRPLLTVVSETPEDPLAQALPWLVRHLGVAAAVEAVVGPVDDAQPVSSNDVLPALRRIGFDAHIQRRTLDSFAAAELPAVLLLRCGDACVLTKRWLDAQGQTVCHVVLPGPQPEEFNATEAEIAAEYSGVALVVSPPKPPFAAALARSRQAAAVAAPAPAPAPAPAVTQDLVALAVAMQNANRAMQSAERESGALSVAAAASVGSPRQARSLQPAAPPGDTEPVPSLSVPGPSDSTALMGLRFMQPAAARAMPWGLLGLRWLHSARRFKEICCKVWRQRWDARAAPPTLRNGARRSLGKVLLVAWRAWGTWRTWCTWVLKQAAGARSLLGRLARFTEAGRVVFKASTSAAARTARAAPAGRRPVPTTVWRTPPYLGPSSPLRQEPHLGQAAATLQNPEAPAWTSLPEPISARDAGPRRLAAPDLGVKAPAPAMFMPHRLVSLSGVGVCALLCMLVGAPLAWARMVSASSAQALHIAPTLLRQALGADPERAAAPAPTHPDTPHPLMPDQGDDIRRRRLSLAGLPAVSA